MRNKHYLSSIHLSQGQKTAKKSFVKLSTLFVSTLMSLFSVGAEAQTVSVDGNSNVSVISKDYDDCSTILEVSLSPSNEYYFEFVIKENGVKLSSSDVSLLGDASTFRFNENNNIVFNSGAYSGPSTFYLNTRNGKPYQFSSEAPSLSEAFLKIDGKTTLSEGESVTLKGIACPTSTSYTYQWYENDKAIAGATDADLANHTPETPYSTFKLEMKEDGTLVKSATTKIRTLGTKQRFSITPWYGLGTYKVTELAGYCNTVYMVEMTFNGNDPQFTINDMRLILGPSDIDNNTSFSMAEQKGDTGISGWRITNKDVNGKSATFYIDARTTPISLVDNIEDKEFIASSITQTKGSNQIERGEATSFSADVCANSSSAITYQWQSSTDNGKTWEDIEGATNSTLEDFVATIDSTNIRIVATSGSISSNSNSILLYFEPSKIITEIEYAQKINDVEYEIPFHDSVKLTILTERIKDPVFSVQVKDFSSSTWRDTVLGTGDIWTFEPKENFVYKVQATGILNTTNEIGTISSEFIIRVIHRCDESATTDTLWFDDFGHFGDANTYITKDVDGVEQTHTTSITDEGGNECEISNYMAADPNFFVKRHEFASLNPLFGPFGGDCGADNYKHYACWEGCNGIRVEDGYYAILTNPNISNCGMPNRDYWDGVDHTGNKNGGMLFVNCSDDSKNTIIYERELTLSNDCDNVQLLFSAYISNASIKEGQKPVNVRLDIRDEDSTLVHSVASGDVMPRNSGERWSNMTFQFKSTGKKKYIIQLTNNNEGGSENYGNDILLDDISITICYPNVNLITDLANKSKDTVETCQLDTTINLYAFNENGIENYIDEPVYLFQYKKVDELGAQWKDIETVGEGIHFSSEDHTSIKLDSTDNRFFGTTKFRAIVASSKEILTDVIQEENENGRIITPVDCDHVYAIDSAFVIIFHYSGPMGPAIDTAGCIGETMTIKGFASDKPEFKWVDAETDTLISENSKELTFLIDGKKDDYKFWFVGTEKMGCTDTQKVHVRKKEFVWFDAPEEFIVCEFDSVLTLTDVVLKNSTATPSFTWELNGTVDTEQTSSKFKIPASAPLQGTIKVTGSADGFCDSTRTIKYIIHQKYSLALDTDVEDDMLCFNSNNNKITLTAVVSPATALPSKFYWYNNGVYVGESSEPTYKIEITENGKYKFIVKSTDDVCYKDSADGPVDTDTISASRTLDMTITTSPENAIICEGESIAVNLEIGNALDDKVVTWESEDLEGGKTTTTTATFKSGITLTPTKSTKFTDKRVLKVSVVDDICNKPITADVNYEVHNNIELSIDPINTFCLSDGDKIALNATVAAGEPTKYVWLEGSTRLDSTDTNKANLSIKEGTNKYSVIASDGVCENKTSEVMTTEARLPISIDIEPKDSVFCEGTTITFRATVKNALDKINVPVLWSGDDLAKDSTIKGENCKLAIKPVKSNKTTEKRSITISTADDVCSASAPVKATTEYTIHNKMDIAILADRTDGLFCLTNEEDNNINLKVDVKAGEPTKYNWYKDDQALGSSTKKDTTLAIGVGTNQYKVIASDGVCADTNSVVVPIKARHQLGLDLNPKNENICEGESIKLIATVTDPLNEATTILWEGDDIAVGSKTIGSPSSYTVKTTKSGKTMQTAYATIKANDAVCQRDTVVSVNYNVYMKVNIELLSNIPNSKICMNNPSNSVATLTINVKKGNPNQFIWNDGSIGTRKDTVRTISLEEGTNTFSVRATDDVCNKIDVSEATANNSIETREPVQVDLFLDHSLVCIGNKIKATADIRNTHPGSSSIIQWSNGNSKSNAANGQYSETYKPSVGSQSIYVNVADANSSICPATEVSAVISAQDSLRLYISPDKATLCQREDTAQYVKLTVGIKSGWPSTVIWSTGDTTRIDTTNTTHILVAPHEDVTYWAYGTDDICKNSDKIYTKEIKVSNKLKVELEIEKPEFQMGEEVVLKAILSNNEYNSIRWYNTETGELLGETSDNEFRYQLDEDTYGTFKLGIVVDNMYCGDIESGKRKITVADYTVIPNIITPYNDNGKNDVFMGPKDGKPGYRVEIYNRYQQMVFEGDNGWDGIYRGHLAEPGTYFYRIFMKDGRVFKGTLEVAKF